MIDLQSFILTYVNEFSYFGMFLLLIIIALIPVPEELILLLVGYFASYGFAELDKVLIVSILGVLVGDNLVFYLSKMGSRNINWIKKKFAPKKLIQYEKLMKTHTGKTIFALRFIIGLRFLSPLIAGSIKVKWIAFFLFNLLAVIIFVPCFIYLGYHFNTILSVLINKILIIKHILFVLILIFLTIVMFKIIKKKFLK